MVQTRNVNIEGGEMQIDRFTHHDSLMRWCLPLLELLQLLKLFPEPRRLEDVMGIARLLDEQQPDDMKTPTTALTEEVKENNGQKRAKAKQIFLGIDAHLRSYEVAIKRDNSAIQAVQRFSFEALLLFAHKQLQWAEEVYAVYEAGPLGYVLYRQLTELGIKAYVSAPECLEQGKLKHKKLDGRKLASRLYSYVQGDREMMRVVSVPLWSQSRCASRAGNTIS